MADEWKFDVHCSSSLKVTVLETSTSAALAGPAVGQNGCMAFATGLIRLAGMMLPGKGLRMNCPGWFGSGRVVSGSKMVTPLWEKSPEISRAVGALTTASSMVLVLYPSMEPQKKVLSFTIGP